MPDVMSLFGPSVVLLFFIFVWLSVSKVFAMSNHLCFVTDILFDLHLLFCNV